MPPTTAPSDVTVCSKGRSLGIDGSDPAKLVKLVRAGFKFSRLEHFQKATGMSLDQIARFAQIPKRTLSRRQASGRLQSNESDRVLRISSIFDLAVDLFEGDKAEARRWLQSPQPGLGGEVPLDFASTEVGGREVENLIMRLERGVFV